MDKYKGEEMNAWFCSEKCMNKQIKSWKKTEDNMKIRRLTPTECERLQGFPDGWTGGVSDTQRYKQMGNAVTVNVIEVIGRRMIEVAD